ncbi:putative membrane-anchored protein [Halopolyspora algeriensis]|uniref:Putative membrane-anchored protein n=1 Tax=Halopolyspora algeriensis TaxID=1500506 RepID=A0A368VST4_9ACTN|nr:putative cytokinetic ring protein SteA [Halopolyspora algeriensis]RCW44725.1 putative membrane-anchored protein [Halopolyspora algeriensis]TQM56082.1 putative membrane-anchored protein [Halopolyspora algeriensis]
MKISGLLGSRDASLPGVVGTARVQRRSGDLLHRLGAGDIAVLDQADLDRRTAESLVAAGVAGVVNAAPSISGRFPNLGPEVLVSAGISLIDGVGVQALREIKDGARIRLYGGSVFVGDREVAGGTEQDADSVADLMIEAKAGMSAQLEAFSANTIEFLRRERMLVLDGVGVPEPAVSMEGRHVLVVTAGYGHTDDLERLKRYIREYRPVLVGVEAGAESMFKAGYSPDVIVGDPRGIGTETLKSGTEVVVPAHVDGHAPGLERIQDLGIGAVTFPASGNPEDLALLLADTHGAELVVTVGFQATLREFLDRGRSGSNPSTFLTRLRLGGKLVDGSAVVALQRRSVPTGAVFALIAAVIAVAVVALAVSGLGASYFDVVADTGRVVLDYLGGVLP